MNDVDWDQDQMTEYYGDCTHNLLSKNRFSVKLLFKDPVITYKDYAQWL